MKIKNKIKTLSDCIVNLSYNLAKQKKRIDALKVNEIKLYGYYEKLNKRVEQMTHTFDKLQSSIQSDRDLLNHLADKTQGLRITPKDADPKHAILESIAPMLENEDIKKKLRTNGMVAITIDINVYASEVGDRNG